ncbi:MAG TPA: alpha/beta hydrolase [Ignavibacteria bacterium]|nr:alpha/beta hydrolase [Ignavibacteria bacterium]
MKEHNISGIKVYDYGDGKQTIIFIHAFPLCSVQWESQVEFFKNKYRVITYDIRGLGYSLYSDNFPLMMEDHSKDLLEICSELKLSKPIVCGLSIGGYIILRAIQIKPELFSKVILANTRAENDTNEILIARHTIISQMKKGKKDLFLNQFLKNVISEKSYSNDKIKNRIREVMSYQTPEGIASTANALATRTDNVSSLKNIDVPVLIISSDEDKTTPVEFSNTLKSEIKNSELEIIKGVGHISNMEAPEKFNEIIERFLLK